MAAATGLYTVVALNDAYAADLNQLIGAENGTVDSGARSLYAQISAPTAPSAAINSTAGNLTGAYSYAVTFETGAVDGLGNLYVAGETQGSAASNTVTPSAEQINLTAIEIGPVGTIARRVWRTKSGGSTYYLLTTLTNETTTSLTDNTPDSSLSATVMPTTNTTGSSIAIWQGTTAPPNPQVGTAWANLTTGILQVYSGTAWVALSAGDATPTAAGIVETTQTVSGTPVASTRVADQEEVTLTGTGAQAVATFTPTVNGVFEIACHFRLTASASVGIVVTYAGSQGAQTTTVLTTTAYTFTSGADNDYDTIPVTIRAVAGTIIDVNFTASVANAVIATANITGR